MNLDEMIYQFWLKAKTLDRVDVESVKTFDVVTVLNDAQEILIDELVKNKAWSYLRPLTTWFSFSDSSIPSYYANFLSGIEPGLSRTVTINLSEIGSVDPYYTYRNYIRSQSVVHRHAAPLTNTIGDYLQSNWTANEDWPNDRIKEIETTQVNIPIFYNPKAILEGSFLTIVGDGYTTIESGVVIFVRNIALLGTTNSSETVLVEGNSSMQAIGSGVGDITFTQGSTTFSADDIDDSSGTGVSALSPGDIIVKLPDGSPGWGIVYYIITSIDTNSNTGTILFPYQDETITGDSSLFRRIEGAVTSNTDWANGVRAVVQTSELPVELHDKIVDIALSIYYTQVQSKEDKPTNKKQ